MVETFCVFCESAMLVEGLRFVRELSFCLKASDLPVKLNFRLRGLVFVL